MLNVIIVCKFGNKQLFNSIFSYIIIINSQITFQILITSLDLFVCFKIKDRKQFDLNIKSFAERFSYCNNKL